MSRLKTSLTAKERALLTIRAELADDLLMLLDYLRVDSEERR